MFYPLNSKFRFAGVVFERSKFQKICQKIKILTLPRVIFICLKQLGEPLMHVPFPQPAQLIKPENSDLGRQFSRKIELSKNDQRPKTKNQKTKNQKPKITRAIIYSSKTLQWPQKQGSFPQSVLTISLMGLDLEG